MRTPPGKASIALGLECPHQLGQFRGAAAAQQRAIRQPDLQAVGHRGPHRRQLDLGKAHAARRRRPPTLPPGWRLRQTAGLTLRLRPGATDSDTYTNAGIVSHLSRGFGANPAGGYAYPVMSLETPGRLRDRDVLGIAMDLDAAGLYYHVNGAWAAGPPPQAGVAIAPGREYRAAVTIGGASAGTNTYDTWIPNFGQAPFAFPMPAGFQPYGGSAVGR